MISLGAIELLMMGALFGAGYVFGSRLMRFAIDSLMHHLVTHHKRKEQKNASTLENR